MTSQRHSAAGWPRLPSRTAANRVEDAEILRATRDSVLAHGVRRTTLTEIARRARISRMTLYRRFPDVSSLVGTLMTRDFCAILRHAREQEGSGTARERLVTATLDTVRQLQDSPLLRRVLDTDAALLLPYLVERLGSTQLAAERFLLDYLADGHVDGSVRHSDPAAQARALLLLVQSFVLSARLTAGTAPDAMNRELAALLDAALRPAPARPAHPEAP
ncbi:TetR/AcrR family transcriptional regulator [Saccharopolyspora gloriosae]|uniref:AcrR family transcriptional regulator n=1 Tax=Saccharopolyspora gloriosae TaxID=455344 RepID=A0A840N8H7_9PSEU|nr:TetR/AcrR family transcriptional regulator [Saccharopolyspora gloriosae]MBB5067121.1 AcrR family transcriptional regulator [Saccharopolyspora gloriosae]